MVYCGQMKVGMCLRPSSQYKHFIISKSGSAVKSCLRLRAIFFIQKRRMPYGIRRFSVYCTAVMTPSAMVTPHAEDAASAGAACMASASTSTT